MNIGLPVRREAIRPTKSPLPTSGDRPSVEFTTAPIGGAGRPCCTIGPGMVFAYRAMRSLAAMSPAA